MNPEEVIGNIKGEIKNLLDHREMTHVQLYFALENLLQSIDHDTETEGV